MRRWDRDPTDVLTTADEGQLKERGISLEQAQRQLQRLAGTHYRELIRPCTVGDGIRQIGEEEIPELHALHAEAARAGRFVKFVPASGAASRMFDSLRQEANLAKFVERLRGFPFYDDLKEQLSRAGKDVDRMAASGDTDPILDALLGPDGLDYAGRPKGLMKFHRYPDGSRTAFEEHLVEAAAYARGEDGVCRLHFTVSKAHRSLFEETARNTEEKYRRLCEARFEIGYSTQKASTDTLALDDAGRPLRDEAGSLRFRPGGHGALIDNLNELQADLIFITNIDNVQPDRVKSVTSHWRRALAGCLLQAQRQVFHCLERLRGSEPAASSIKQAEGLVGALGCRLRSPSVPELIDCLDRPLRVCGVVPNTGEPGGGPFWVQGPDGSVSLQIVEASQVDPNDDRQQGRLGASTHFNPVDLVCGVRNHTGRPFDLFRYIDDDAVIVTRKSVGTDPQRVLERPGLWNGAMARWTTLFVEVPIETFSPVKTVLDLVRDEHQPD